MKKVLTIAGSDSGGGAGIQADLKTMTAHRVYGASVITSVTAQNTLGVQGVNNLEADFVAKQIDSVLSDIEIDALKTGMLGTKEIVELTAEKIAEYQLDNLVVDPVMVASSGDLLLEKNAVSAYKEKIFPLAKIITPNLMEAKVLAGLDPEDEADAKWLAEELIKFGSEYVLIKGGHYDLMAEDRDTTSFSENNAEKVGSSRNRAQTAVKKLNSPETFRSPKRALDLLYDGVRFTEFEAEYIKTEDTHGTGCTLSAALASNLAKGYSIYKSVENSKVFITRAIKNGFKVGNGHNPVNHLISI